MKNPIKNFWLLIVVICQNSTAQTINLKSIQSAQHILNTGIGWDYGLTYSLGYGYQLKTKLPIIANGSFSIPSGKKLLDDFKFRPGVQVVVLNRENLKSSISTAGIYRRYENPLVCLQNVGCEVKATFGYYKSSWFVSVEFGFDKAIATHFEHSESYRENVYADIQDGWYKPASGGNILYGFQTGYSFKKMDLTLNLGKVATQDFKSSPLIPYYMSLGVSYKIGNSTE